MLSAPVAALIGDVSLCEKSEFDINPMVHIANESISADERGRAALVLMRPGIWYCINEYAGCEVLPEYRDGISSQLLESLVEKGYVESVPVFEGFIIRKHRITAKGVDWLRTI